MMFGRYFAVITALALGGCAYGEASLRDFSTRHPGADILPVEFVKQRAAADSGPAALTSVARYWGTDTEARAIAEQAAPANPALGYSIGELHAASERLGLASARLLEQPDYMMGLLNECIPVIAPVAKPYERRDIFDFMLSSMLSQWIVNSLVGEEEPTINHYVVVLGADDQLVYVLDPQDGYQAIKRAEFLAHWRQLTSEFVPDAGANVAGFVTYQVMPEQKPIVVGIGGSRGK